MVKGAIDRIMAMCVGYLEGGVTQRPLSAEQREQILHLAQGLGQSGLRGFRIYFTITKNSSSVIGMASGRDMSSLFYAGLVGIMDPPRPGCRQSIETVQSAGVSVKMVTGDALETASSIGQFISILKINLY